MNRRKHLIALARVLFATLVAIVLTRASFDYIEAAFYDFRVISRPAAKPTGLFELVMIDSTTVEAFKSVPEAKFHTPALQAILAQNPKMVLYVTDLSALKGTPAERKELADLVRAHKNVLQMSVKLELKDDESSKLVMAPPFEGVSIVSAPKTTDGKILAKDGITRRMFISYQEQLTFHPILASQINSDITDTTNIRGQFDVYDSKQVMIDYRKPKAYSLTKFEAVALAPAGKFTDKYVLIGEDLGLSHEDYVYTPYLRNNNSTTVTELHANMFETLITNSSPAKAPNWFNVLITILISILTVHVVLTVKPLKGILILISTAALFTIVAYLAFWPFGIWIEMAHPFLAIFLCYYFFIPYRLIVENRKSWEYYQKHKLLSEVEQLKTNFIGLMSHDLKTPLARIQGMTEIIQKDASPLSSSQREALDLIKQSSVDLTAFISTILNYAKIESQGVELHKQSKDINQLLLEVVKKHEFLAKLKHIELKTELETLFSIKVDPELIKQVLSNLIENAIKYSPENSKVLISSEEIEGKIVIQVADQGSGIPSDELPNVFMKFFRSNNAKSSPIKGSGLGLYLAKYFVELHQGRIYCESTESEGSTFTVELPISN